MGLKIFSISNTYVLAILNTDCIKCILNDSHCYSIIVDVKTIIGHII